MYIGACGGRRYSIRVERNVTLSQAGYVQGRCRVKSEQKQGWTVVYVGAFTSYGRFMTGCVHILIVLTQSHGRV